MRPASCRHFTLSSIELGRLLLPASYLPSSPSPPSPLQGEQEREVVRVLLHCCLAESSWNPYYGHLALKLARSSKAHRMTMQVGVGSVG